MSLVPLNNVALCFAVVDEADLALVSKHTWTRSKCKRTFYAMTTIDGKTVLMHRLLMGLAGPQVDHENGCGLDNRRENLRHATREQNARNTCRRSDNTSGVKGVYEDKRRGTWTANVFANGRRHYRTGLASREAAELQAQQLRRELHGEFACDGRTE